MPHARMVETSCAKALSRMSSFTLRMTRNLCGLSVKQRKINFWLTNTDLPLLPPPFRTRYRLWFLYKGKKVGFVTRGRWERSTFSFWAVAGMSITLAFYAVSVCSISQDNSSSKTSVGIAMFLVTYPSLYAVISLYSLPHLI